MGLQGVIILQFYYVCTLKQERKFKNFEDGAKVKKKSEIKPPLGRRRWTKKIHITTKKKVLQQ